ncbi:MAG: sensor domain-containing protein [Angustibacter sp.]
MSPHTREPLRALRPFTLAALIGAAIVLLPPVARDGVPLPYLVVAASSFAGLVVLLRRLPDGHPLRGAPPLLAVLLLGLAHDANGGTESGLGPLVLLPVLWVALHGSRKQLWLTAAAVVAVSVVPMALVGPPRYALGGWRDAVLWAVVIVVVCPTVQHTVEQLRQSCEEHSRLAGQLSSVLRAATEHAVIATDLRGTVTLFSEGAEYMLGYDADQLVGVHSPIVLHDPDELGAHAAEVGVQPGFAVLVADVPAHGASSRFWTYVRQDGSTLRVRSTVTRLLDDDGDQIGWISVGRDVTADEVARRQRHAAERRVRQLLEHLPDTTVMVVGPDLGYRLSVGAGLHQHTADETATRAPEVFLGPNSLLLRPLYRAALTQGRIGTTELHGQDGHAVVEVTVLPFPGQDGDREALVVARDITVARRRLAELAAARDHFAQLFDESPHGAVLLDSAGLVIRVNPVFCRMVGVSVGDVVGAPGLSLPFSQPDDETPPLEELLRGDIDRLESERTIRPPGREPVHLVISAVALRRSGQDDRVLVTLMDISERKRFEEKLAHLAEHDPLTGLANRRKFEAELTAHLDRCRRYGAQGALIMLDLDHFKDVNDTLGHCAGDRLIVQVGAVLKNRMRTADVVTRLGGDEFAVLLPFADREAAEVVARDICRLIREQVRVGEGESALRVSGSLGVTLIRDPRLTASELLSTADMTMYDAKDAGRDRFVIQDSLSDPGSRRPSSRSAWADQITLALEAGRFVVHAQPVRDLRTGRVTGAELLVRMLDDVDEVILPDRFLTVAERAGLVPEIDLFVLGEAVLLLKQMQELEETFGIEVNLSGHSVGQPRMIQHIARLVAEHGVDPRGLMLEMTETAAVANLAVTRTFTERLEDIGCRFALDRFNAGLRSFHDLEHVRFGVVKIDGELVSTSSSNPTDRLILQSIVRIAHGLGKEIVAESVADQQTLDVVTALGIDQAQGYLIGRPEPVPQLVERVRAEHGLQLG